jgi:hypothetical protein
MKTKTNIIYPPLGAFAFACFTLAPAVRAVDPPPDGGYPNVWRAKETESHRVK